MKSKRQTGEGSVTRREFLQKGAVAVGAAAALGTSQWARAASAPIPAIDSHVHFFDPGKPGGVPWPPKGNQVLYSAHLPETYKPIAEKLGVVGVVVIEANALPADNEWVLALAKDNPLIVGYQARLQPGQEDFAATFNRYAENPICRGLRLSHPMTSRPDNAAFEKDIKLLAERKFTLDIIGNSQIFDDIMRLDKIAPGITYVIDHLPFPEWNSDPAAMRKGLAAVAALPNVYAKISNVIRRVDGKPVETVDTYYPVLDALRESFGDDRIIYGSNWPVSDLTAPYGLVHQVVAEYFGGRDKAAAEKFFWKNSLAAYRWIPRGAAAALVTK